MKLQTNPWWDKYFPINIGLTGNFVEMYEKRKPKGMNDQDFVNTVLSSWLMENES